MEILLNNLEARVLGAFIEKDMTTPDYYPLSPNALTNACNQKSNRDPVLQLSETEVLEAVEGLRKKGLAMQSQDAGSRVTKYRHTLRERLYLEEQELAILAELLLRGPQTPGEIRARADRMATLSDLEDADRVLQELMEKEPPLICKLPRQPGRKECRFAQLLCGPIAEEPASAQSIAPPAMGKSFSEMETELSELRGEVAELKKEFQRFKEQFE